MQIVNMLKDTPINICNVFKNDGSSEYTRKAQISLLASAIIHATIYAKSSTTFRAVALMTSAAIANIVANVFMGNIEETGD